jgi:hypothetical protein
MFNKQFIYRNYPNNLATNTVAMIFVCLNNNGNTLFIIQQELILIITGRLRGVICLSSTTSAMITPWKL